MSVGARRVPGYRLYRPKNLGVVRLNGRDHYLGPFGTAESRRRYDALIAKWLANNRQPILVHRENPRAGGPTINEMLLTYWEYAKVYYVKHGQPTGELGNMRAAIRPLRAKYGSLDAATFGPADLEARAA